MESKVVFKPKMHFDPREYFEDELKARGLRLDQCIFTIRRWFTSEDAMTPKVAWAISVVFGTSQELWLNLDAAWQSRNAPASALHPLAPALNPS